MPGAFAEEEWTPLRRAIVPFGLNCVTGVAACLLRENPTHSTGRRGERGPAGARCSPPLPASHLAPRTCAQALRHTGELGPGCQPGGVAVRSDRPRRGRRRTALQPARPGAAAPSPRASGVRGERRARGWAFATGGGEQVESGARRAALSAECAGLRGRGTGPLPLPPHAPRLPHIWPRQDVDARNGWSQIREIQISWISCDWRARRGWRDAVATRHPGAGMCPAALPGACSVFVQAWKTSVSMHLVHCMWQSASRADAAFKAEQWSGGGPVILFPRPLLGACGSAASEITCHENGGKGWTGRHLNNPSDTPFLFRWSWCVHAWCEMQHDGGRASFDQQFKCVVAEKGGRVDRLTPPGSLCS